MFHNLGADYIFVGPAEREARRHPEKYRHPQYFKQVYRHDDFEIYQVQALPYQTNRPQAAFDAGTIEFEGYFIDQVARYPGNQAGPDQGLVTAWRLTRAADKNYTVFIHLVDAGGNILAQADHQLWAWDVKEEGPSSRWTPNLTHLDIVPVPETASNSSSPISIRLGLWLPETGEQFPVEASIPKLDEGGRLIIGNLRN